MKKENTILTFGASGEIGLAVTQRFCGEGWHAHSAVRNTAKPESQTLMQLPHSEVTLCDPSNKESVVRFLRQLKDAGIVPDIVFQSTGTFLWDDGFPSQGLFQGSPAQIADAVAEYLWQANYVTKQNVIDALFEVMPDQLAHIDMRIIGSHAGSFAADHPLRNGPFKQEGYVRVMKKLIDLGEAYAQNEVFKNVTLYQTGLIDTHMTRTAFPPERAPDIDWRVAKKPRDYAIELFPQAFFLQKKAA